MRTRYRVALVAAVYLACSPLGLQAQGRTEQDIVELIVRESAQAKAIRAVAESVTAEQAARSTFPNPAVSYAHEGAGLTQFFQMEQALPAFGLRGALERAGVAARESADAERDARLWQLRIDAHLAFARWRAADERLEGARSVERLVEQLIGVLITREREGEGSRFDRVRSEQELVDARQTVTSAEVDRLAARGAISAMLPPNTPLPDSIARPSVTANLDPAEALVQKAATSRAELRALESSARRFTLESEAAKRAVGPAATINGGVKRADDNNDMRTGGVVGISLTLPLFNRAARDVTRWNAERARVEFERAVVEAAIRAEITTAAAILSLRRQVATMARDSLSSADELVTMADVAYREGEAGILQLLDAYRTRGRAQERAAAAALELRLGEIALERAVGVTLWP
ncbi:MAG TPA: TolC family protein [Vicinamibacterales bacterium]|jgi:cobalt-zinc-cadmium efflux system outer membrane protein